MGVVVVRVLEDDAIVDARGRVGSACPACKGAGLVYARTEEIYDLEGSLRGVRDIRDRCLACHGSGIRWEGGRR